MTERPHLIQYDGEPLRPASLAEVAPVIAQHAAHDGIAYFSNCPACVEAKAAGKYPQWDD